METVPISFLLALLATATALTNQEFAIRNNLFAASVYKEAIKSGDKNLLVSPLSAEIVLALTQSGARDTTAKEIRSSLHLPQNDQDIKTSYRNLLQNLKSEDNFTLHTANKIYVGQNIPIKEDFKKIATDTYQAEIENIDFSQTVKAADTINQWVEKKTEHKIKNLVDPSVLNSGTLAFIVNTLYFKAKWIDKDFYMYPIFKRDFYKTPNEVVAVDTMSQFGASFNFYEDVDLKARFLALPLKGENNFLIIALPKAKDGLPDLEKEPQNVFKKHDFKIEIVDVTLPLFKIESQIDFKRILGQLGVTKAFSKSEADFSGIAGNKGDLAIGGILQKTFINVDQSGVEAAAATDLWFFTSGPPRATVEFKVDHPFIFYIQVNGVILFTGKVTDPKT